MLSGLNKLLAAFVETRSGKDLDRSKKNVGRGERRRFLKRSRNHTSSSLVSEALEQRLLLTAGELDATFGNAGLQATDFTDLTGLAEQTNAVEVAADGKLVSGGVQTLFFGVVGFVVRHNADGTLDTSFGDGGRVAVDIFQTVGITDLTVLADNSILVTGSVFNASQDFGVLKLQPNGDIDTTFGNRGLATIDFGPGNVDTPRAIVQKGANIVVAGDTNVGGNVDFAVVELDATGNPTAFGQQVVDFDLGGGNSDIAYDVQVDASGRILLAGSAEITAGVFDFALARLTAAGALDTTFSGGKVNIDFGTVGTPTNDEAFSVAIDADGSIYPAGVTSPTVGGTQDFAIARLNSQGVLQNGFDTDGKVIQDFAPGGDPSNDRIAEIKIQGGNLVVAGQSREFGIFNPQVDFAVGAFNKLTGALIPTFNPATGGRIHTTFFAYAEDAGNALAIDGDGNWIIAGNVGLATNPDSPTTIFGTSTNIALARYSGTSGQLDATFGNGGRVVADTTESSGFGDSSRAVEVLADGKIVAGGSTRSDGGVPIGSVARYNADGTLDSSFGFGGRVTIGLFGNGITDLTVLADNSILVTGPVFNASQDFGVLKLQPNGDIDTTFGNRGLATIDFGPGNVDTPRAIVQKGANIVVAGDTNVGGNVDFAVVELDATGNPTAFGQQVVDFDLGGGNSDIAYDVQVDASGRILLAGSAEITAGVFDFALARLTAAGALDTTFSGGKVNIDFGTVGTPTNDEAFSVAIDADGSIYPAGVTSPTAGGTQDFAIARLNSQGVLQNGFDTDGKVIQDFAPGGDPSNDRIAEIKIQGGNLVVAGQSREFGIFNPQVDFAVGAFNKLTGALIPTPNPSTGGRVHATFFANNEDAGYALDIDAAGNWVIAGATGLFTDGFAPTPAGFEESTNYGLVRINSTDGQLDAAFGNSGRVATDFTNLSGSDDESYGVEVQADGKIVAAGGTSFFGNNEGAVVRYNADGTLDTTFGINGRVSIGIFSALGFVSDSIGGIRFGISDLTVLADGSILVTGPVTNASQDFGVMKLTPGGNIDTTFGNRGLATIDFGPGNFDTPRSIVQNGANIVVAGDTNSAGNSDFAVVELDATGNPTAFGRQIVNFNLGGTSTDIANDVKIDAAGRILLAGSTETAAGVFDFGLARLTASGTPDATFGGGRVNIDFGTGGTPTNDEAFSVVVGEDGSIYAAGFTAPTGGGISNFALAKLSNLGVLQNGFGTGGKVIQDFAPGGNPSNDLIGEVALQDGNIVTGGGSTEDITLNPFSAFATGQFDQNSGALDATINPSTGGRNHTRFLTFAFAESTGLALQGDGKWVQTGFTGDLNDNFAIARFSGPNAAPVVDGLAPVEYTEGDGATPIAAAATVVDADGDNIQSMTISLTNAVAADGASIDVTLSGGIVKDGASTTTNLILTGSATADAYQAVLRTLVYNNPSEDPTDAPDRTVTVVTQDSNGGSSAVQTITIDVVPVADLPVVDLNGAADGTGFTVQFGAAATAIVDPAALTVTDVDTPNLVSATATITNFQTGDGLAVTESGGITAALVDGVLTLTGSTTPAAYETVLRTLTFNTSSTNTDARTIEVKANDGADGPVATATVAFGVAPVVDLNGADDGINSTATYNTSTGGPQSIANAAATVTDADAGDMIQSATITISAGALTGDVLAVTDGGGITSAFAGNVLTLSGSATPAAYETVLRTLSFTATSTDTTARTVTVIAKDAAGSDSAAAVITVEITDVPPTAVLDLDGSGGDASAQSDGLLVFAALAGVTDQSQLSQLLSPSATKTVPEVLASVTALRDDLSLDVDGNGAVSAQSDGLLIFAVLAGVTNEAQLSGLIAPGAPNSPAQVIAAVNALRSPAAGASSSAASAQVLAAVLAATDQPSTENHSDRDVSLTIAASTEHSDVFEGDGRVVSPVSPSTSGATLAFAGTAATAADSDLELLDGYFDGLLDEDELLLFA